MIRVNWKVLAILLVAALSSCSGEVTDSEEYLALQADLDERAVELDAVRSELSEVQASRHEAQKKLEAADSAREHSEDRASTLEASLRDAQAQAEQAESALEAELNRPWPEEVKDLFVEGCTETPNEGLTDQQERAIRKCSMDALEAEVSLIDFMTFSILTFSDVDAELNPITGLPAGVDEAFAETLVNAAVGCILEV